MNDVGSPVAWALLRPRQWIKNVFVAAPLVFTPGLLTAGRLGVVALAVIAFCALSSGAYVFNDIRDREADRLHPKKLNRPLAAGAISLPRAGALALAMIAAAGIIAAFLPSRFAMFAGAYLALNLAYSLWLKRIAVLDVMVIAICFVLRLEAGGAAVDVKLSAWIVIITGLLALFLALAKRRDDLVRELPDGHRTSMRGYNRAFLDIAVSVTLGGVLVAYLIYTTDTTVMARLGTEDLYLTAPFVVAGILRYLQITLVEERSGSPADVLLTDRFLLLTVVGWMVTFLALIYG